MRVTHRVASGKSGGTGRESADAGTTEKAKKNTERKEESKRARQANKSSRAVARGNEEGDTEVEVDKDRMARGRSRISPEERRGREGDTWDRKTRQSLTHSDGCGYR
jgi:hypothetical protein